MQDVGRADAMTRTSGCNPDREMTVKKMKTKKLSLNTTNMIVGIINYAATVGPLAAAAVSSGDIRYALAAPSVALLGEVVKSFSISDVTPDEDVKGIFEEQSREALYDAWDTVIQAWSQELPPFSDEDIENLKVASYGKIFSFDEGSGTADMDQSPVTVRKIQESILSLLRDSANHYNLWSDAGAEQDGFGQEDFLNTIAAAVTMSFFDTLAKGIKKKPELYSQLDRGEIKLRLDKLERELEKLCSDELAKSSSGKWGYKEDVERWEDICKAYKKESSDLRNWLDGRLNDIENELKKRGCTEDDTNKKVTFMYDYFRTGGSTTQQVAHNAVPNFPDAAAISELIHNNPIRRLSEKLWVNWKTGVLASDFRSVLADDAGEARIIAGGGQYARGGIYAAPDGQDIAAEGQYAAPDGGYTAADGQTANSNSTGFICRLTRPQRRLLSILVQGEGAVIRWDEIASRIFREDEEADGETNAFRRGDRLQPAAILMEGMAGTTTRIR
jgi:hypothetical protein